MAILVKADDPGDDGEGRGRHTRVASADGEGWRMVHPMLQRRGGELHPLPAGGTRGRTRAEAAPTGGSRGDGTFGGQALLTAAGRHRGMQRESRSSSSCEVEVTCAKDSCLLMWGTRCPFKDEAMIARDDGGA